MLQSGTKMAIRAQADMFNRTSKSPVTSNLPMNRNVPKAVLLKLTSALMFSVMSVLVRRKFEIPEHARLLVNAVDEG